MMHYRRQADEQTVRTALHNLYRECRGFGRKSVLTPEQDTMLKLNESWNAVTNSGTTS